MSRRFPIQLKRIVTVAVVTLAAASAVAVAKPATASAASTPIFVGWGGGQAGPVQLFGVSLTCQVGAVPATGKGQFDIQAQTFAPSNVKYNWAAELQEWYGGAWHRVLLSATKSYQGGNPINGFDARFFVPINLSYPYSFRGFFWVQNPLSGQWYYAGGLSSSGQYCTV